MDTQRYLQFTIDSYDGIAKIFETHIKEHALTVIERGKFDTRAVLKETFQCSDKELKETMLRFGTNYTAGPGNILVINDEYLLRSEILSDEDSQIRFKLWILTIRERTDKIIEELVRVFEPYIYNKMALDVTWAIAGSRGVEYIDIQSDLDSVVLPESYPYIPELDAYIQNYLNHKAPVLILIGPPGTGKTRLIKHILKTMGYRKNGMDFYTPDGAPLKTLNNPRIIYSMEDKIFKDDQFFVRFLSDQFDAMVLEDIDFNLGSRKDGNTFMYKLLGGSDGIVSGIKRKIILSTNLRGLSNIDEALLRPGRCFGTVHTKPLNAAEAKVVMEKLGKSMKAIPKKDKPEYTLAELYNS